MTLIERYIALRVTRMAFAAVLPVLAVIWIIQVLGRINLVTDSGQSIGSFLELAALILPTVLPMVLPFGVVIGVAQTLATMNSDSELAVIDAAGASRMILLRPIIVVSLAASILSFSVSNFLVPVVRVEARKMVAAVYADLLSTVIEEKTFRRVENNLYIQISKRLQGRVLQGLFVADYRNPASELIYYAKEGAVNESGTTLIMHDGEVDRRTADGNLSIVRFVSYAFDLSQFSQARSHAGLRAIDRDLKFLFNPDKNDSDYKRFTGDYRAELHRRLTEWSFPLVYALIALAIAGQTRTQREIRSHPVILAMGLTFILRWVSFYVSNKISGSGAFILPLYMIPTVLAIGSTALFLSAKTIRLPAWMSVAQIVRSVRNLIDAGLRRRA
jgi:lipopolysaccharide export system permease protein